MGLRIHFSSTAAALLWCVAIALVAIQCCFRGAISLSRGAVALAKAPTGGSGGDAAASSPLLGLYACSSQTLSSIIDLDFPGIVSSQRAWQNGNALTTINAWFNMATPGVWKPAQLPQHPHQHVAFDMLGPAYRGLCPLIDSFGMGDLEKRSCALRTIAPRVKAATAAASDRARLKAGAQQSERCVVISIGSNGEWDFEIDIVDDTNCVVHTLDCTCGPTCRMPSALSATGRVHFYPYCVAAETNSTGNFVSYLDMLRMLNLTSAPTYMKFDIEGFEWQLIPSLLTSPSVPRHLLPEQLAFELHVVTQPKYNSLGWQNRQKSGS